MKGREVRDYVMKSLGCSTNWEATLKLRKLVKQKRVEKGVSQRQIASLLKVPPGEVSRLEIWGRAYPKAMYLVLVYLEIIKPCKKLTVK